MSQAYPGGTWEFPNHDESAGLLVALEVDVWHPEVRMEEEVESENARSRMTWSAEE